MLVTTRRWCLPDNININRLKLQLKHVQRCNNLGDGKRNNYCNARSFRNVINKNCKILNRDTYMQQLRHSSVLVRCRSYQGYFCSVTKENIAATIDALVTYLLVVKDFETMYSHKNLKFQL